MSSSTLMSFWYQDFLREPNNNVGQYEWIDLTINLKHFVWIRQQHTQILFQTHPIQLSLRISSQEFFLNGATYIRVNIPRSILSDRLLDIMMPQVKFSLLHFLRNRDFNGYIYNPLILSLHLDVGVNSLLNDHQVVDIIARESINEVKMIPASQEAIESLKEVNIEDDDETKQCSICLEEYDDSSEISAMPCKHVYHQQCIMKWLETSHMCPLCRHPMPV